MPALILPSPIGDLTLIANDEALTDVRFGASAGDEPIVETPLLRMARKELEAYFSGTLKRFTLPLSPKGTPFQRRVWDALLGIPYGQTASYGEIAARVGNPKASRAVGMANHRNPLAIIIPCHRVIGKNGRMVGYGGGLPVKEWLLKWEQGKK